MIFHISPIYYGVISLLLPTILVIFTSGSNTYKMEASFAKNLKRIRQEKKLTQDELGKMVGVHANHISRYERGDSSPSTETLLAFADALDVTIDELVVGNRKQEAMNSLNDIELIKLLKKIEVLDENGQQTVKSLIDAYIFKHEMQARLVS